MSNITINFLLEPDTSFSTIGLLLFFLFIFIIYFISWKKYKSKEKQKKLKSYLKSSFFQLSTGVIAVAVLISITLKDNIYHEYIVSQKYFSIDEKGIFFTIEEYPHGKRNINDDFQSVLFITAMITKFNRNIEAEFNNCEVSLVMGIHTKKITIHNISESLCKNLSHDIQNTVNYHRDKKNGNKQFPAIAMIFKIN